MTSVENAEVELPPIPELPDMTMMFPPKEQKDYLSEACRKYWNLVSEEDGKVTANGYKELLQSIIKLSQDGDESTAAAISYRISIIESNDNNEISFDSMKERLHTIINTILPQSDIGNTVKRLDALYNEITEEDLNPPPDHQGPALLQLKTTTSADRNPSYATLRNLLPLVPGVQGKQKNNFIILGDPCTGKTNLGNIIADKTNAFHLDIYSLVVREIESKSSVGEDLLKLVTECKQIPVNQQASLIKSIIYPPDGSPSVIDQNGFIFSEFPPLPSSAYGDEQFSNWIKWCGLPTNGHVISIVCRDSLDACDEWCECYRQRQKRIQEEAATEQSLRYEEATELESLINKFRPAPSTEPEQNDEPENKTPADDPPPEAEPEEEEDEEVISAKRNRLSEIESRRLSYDIQTSIHKGWEAFFGSDWEGDTPFISPASHSDIAPLTQRAIMQGTFIELPHYESTVNQYELLHKYILPSPTDIVQCPVVPEPEDSNLEDAEKEFFDSYPGGQPSLSPFQKTCCVTYKKHQINVTGLYYHFAIYRGLGYFFTSKENKEAFVKTPDYYLEGGAFLQNNIILLVAKHPGILDQLNCSEEELIEFASRQMMYSTISLGDYQQKWSDTLTDYRQLIDEREKLREEVLEKLRNEEEERNREKKKAGKKKDPKKKKKKDEDEPPPPPEPEAEPEPTEVKELTPQEKKDSEVEMAIVNNKRNLSLLIHSFVMSSDSELQYLKDEKLIPNTILLLDIPPPPKPETDEDDQDQNSPDESGSQPEVSSQNADVPAGPLLDPSDPEKYRKEIQNFFDKLTSPPAEGSEDPTPDTKPPPAIHTINCNNITDHEDLITCILHTIDPFVRGATAEDPTDEEPEADDDDNTSTQDKRLIPGPSELSRYGPTGLYCPIALRKEKMFILGNKKFGGASYREKKFIFSNESAKTTFLTRPWEYSKVVREEDWPPPALMIFGNSFCHEKEICESLKNNFGIIPISFSTDSLMSSVDLVSSTDPDNVSVQEALKIKQDLIDFETKQQIMAKLKDSQEGDDHDEPELDSWEPEEDEAKEERITTAHLKFVFLFVVPFISNSMF